MQERQNNKQWIVLTTANEVALAVRNEIMQAAQTSIDDHGEFRIVLAGGTTPEKVYHLLAAEQCDWQHWHIYLGDERCLAVGDPERNSEMIKRTLLDEVAIPAENIHFISTEQGAETAADLYSEIIRTALPFDVVMLGMGEDGHTASLFPHQQHNKNERVHAVYDAPKPPAERVSLSVDSLSNNHYLLIMITGQGKQYAVRQWQQGNILPVTKIGSLAQNAIKIFVDRAACGEN